MLTSAAYKLIDSDFDNMLWGGIPHLGSNEMVAMRPTAEEESPENLDWGTKSAREIH